MTKRYAWNKSQKMIIILSPNLLNDTGSLSVYKSKVEKQPYISNLTSRWSENFGIFLEIF